MTPPLPPEALDAIEGDARARPGEALANTVIRLVEEVRRKQRLIGAAASFCVGSDAYCRACGRTLVAKDAEHGPDCIVAEIEREARA